MLFFRKIGVTIMAKEQFVEATQPEPAVKALPPQLDAEKLAWEQRIHDQYEFNKKFNI